MDTDVIVAGAGIAGLSAALELARGGARVSVFDMNSVGSGHAILSSGIAIAAMPLQEARGFDDSPEKAYTVWMNYTGDGNPQWTRFYAENSRRMIYDWLFELGVRFDHLARDAANRKTPRFHSSSNGGAGITLPLYDGLAKIRPRTLRYRDNLDKYQREVLDNQGLAPPELIHQPPFYAVGIYPNALKSMGGVGVDRHTRVLDQNGRIIPGLYAAGELTGSVGINASHGLNGMFLGPALVTGRLAGQTVLETLSQTDAWQPQDYKLLSMPEPHAGGNEPPLDATDLKTLLLESRPGYWHFETSHRLLLERGDDCGECHSPALPQTGINDNHSQLVRTRTCRSCH